MADATNLIRAKTPKAYSAYTIYFRLERMRILQENGFIDKCREATFDPNHFDPLEHPRPIKYKDIILPPYWYSSKQRQKRKHRKQEGNFSKETLTAMISKSWRTLDHETLAYCNKLSRAEKLNHEGSKTCNSKLSTIKNLAQPNEPAWTKKPAIPPPNPQATGIVMVPKLPMMPVTWPTTISSSRPVEALKSTVSPRMLPLFESPPLPQNPFSWPKSPVTKGKVQINNNNGHLDTMEPVPISGGKAQPSDHPSNVTEEDLLQLLETMIDPWAVLGEDQKMLDTGVDLSTFSGKDLLDPVSFWNEGLKFLDTAGGSVTDLMSHQKNI